MCETYLLKKYINIVRIFFYKISHRKRLFIEPNQDLWGARIHFEIEKGGSVQIEQGVTIRHDAQLWCTKGASIVLGKYSFINTGTILCARNSIKVGDYTGIGPNVCIYDHDHDFLLENGYGFVDGEVNIGKHVWILSNVCIFKNVTIGDNSVICAGAIITKDIPPNSYVKGQRELSIKKRIITSRNMQ